MLAVVQVWIFTPLFSEGGTVVGTVWRQGAENNIWISYKLVMGEWFEMGSDKLWPGYWGFGSQQTGSRAHPVSGYWGSFSKGVMLLECEADHSPPPSAECT